MVEQKGCPPPARELTTKSSTALHCPSYPSLAHSMTPREVLSVASRRSTTTETDGRVPFPRGGGATLTSLDPKVIGSDATAARIGATAARIGAHMCTGATSCSRPSSMNDEPSKKVHRLARHHVVPGVRLLGGVSDVASDRLQLQLPGQLTGRVRRLEVSDELQAGLADASVKPPDLRKLFAVGEVLLCAVLPGGHCDAPALTHRKGINTAPIELTLRLSVTQSAPLSHVQRVRRGMLVWGVSCSGEDYGHVMSTGTPAGGFLHTGRFPTLPESDAGMHSHAEHTISAAPCSAARRAPPRHRPVLCAVVGDCRQQQQRPPIQLVRVHSVAFARPIPEDAAIKFEVLQS